MKVQLTPLGVNIKYRILGKVFCSQSDMEISNSASYHKSDALWDNIFTEEDKTNFILKGKAVIRNLTLPQLGYDKCDYTIEDES